jgi:hypothetical protein
MIAPLFPWETEPCLDQSKRSLSLSPDIHDSTACVKG